MENQNSDATACLLPHNSNSLDYYQKGKSFIHLYDQDVKVKKVYLQGKVQVGGGVRSNVFEFSENSRRNLLLTCRNSGHNIKSQILLTYHTLSPIDGREVKRNLNTFLVLLRRHFPDTYYLWVLEFQNNGHPHIHLFLSIEPSKENRLKLARFWNTTTNESPENLVFTSHCRNFFRWNMKSGKYLSKEYITKSVQKDVPKNFKNVGRFWGCSRNMTPKFVVIRPDSEIPEKIYKKVLRAVSKKHEKIIEGFKKKKVNLRTRHQSYSLPLCATSFITYAQMLIHQESSSEPITWATNLASLYQGVPF